MSVKVRIPLLLSKYANGQELLGVAGYSPIECAHNLVVQFPNIRRWLYDKQGELRPQAWFFVNGERIPADELTNLLRDGDELFIFLALGGG
ncbi:MAG: molybdopterin synthase sulfur carrier subunit [Dehalococcoidia bacterium]|nr:molybdopterin synthase sulfur carrier subunit [Dehalococcoidia bacterium]